MRLDLVYQKQYLMVLLGRMENRYAKSFCPHNCTRLSLTVIAQRENHIRSYFADWFPCGAASACSETSEVEEYCTNVCIFVSSEVSGVQNDRRSRANRQPLFL